MDKINNQRVEEVATKLYKRLSERASQKFGRIDESFLHDYKLDEDGLIHSIPFGKLWQPCMVREYRRTRQEKYLN